jgi:hypothetical protein
MNRFAAATIATSITLFSIGGAFSLDVNQTIGDWAAASPTEKTQLAEMYTATTSALSSLMMPTQ